MKRLDFTIVDANDDPLHEPGFVECEADLPMAVMEAVIDFLEAYNGRLALPLRIEVTAPGDEAA